MSSPIKCFTVFHPCLKKTYCLYLHSISLYTLTFTVTISLPLYLLHHQNNNNWKLLRYNYLARNLRRTSYSSCKFQLVANVLPMCVLYCLCCKLLSSIVFAINIYKKYIPQKIIKSCLFFCYLLMWFKKKIFIFRLPNWIIKFFHCFFFSFFIYTYIFSSSWTWIGELVRMAQI